MPLSPGGFASAPDDMDALQEIMDANHKLHASLVIQEYLRSKPGRKEERAREYEEMRARRAWLAEEKIWTQKAAEEQAEEDDAIAKGYANAAEMKEAEAAKEEAAAEAAAADRRRPNR